MSPRLIFLSLVLCLFAAPALAQSCNAKMQTFVSNSGYKITEARPCAVWFINGALNFPTANGSPGIVLVATQDNTGVIGVVVQTKAKLRPSADLLMQLMQLAHQMDYIKIGIDDDGDLFARSELYLPDLTQDGFNIALKNVIAGSAKVYALAK
jgi:hypothetical protein